MSFYRDFAEVYERVFPVREAVVAAVVARLGTGASLVLDVGCGPGHLCARLEQAGHSCTGIDLDGAMIERAKGLYPDLDVRELDMRRVGDVGGVYDAGLCLGNVLPHLDRVDAKGFLGSLHHELSQSAPWIVQTVNFDRLSGEDRWTFPPLEVGDGLIFERRYEGLGNERCRFMTRLHRHGEELFAGDVPMTPWTIAELHDLHRDAGFEPETAAADAAGSPYDPATSMGRWLVYCRD